MKKTIVLLDWEQEDKWFSRRTVDDPFSSAYFGLNIPAYFKTFFNLELYQKDKTYNKQQHVFVLCDIYHKNNFIQNSKLYEHLRDQGFKVILLHFVEYFPEHHPDVYCTFPIFYIDNWFWFNEVLRHMNGWASFKDNKRLILCPVQYSRVSNRNKLALMPVGKLRRHRVDLLSKINPLLKNMVWSCKSQNILLPRNKDFEHQYNSWEYEHLGIINDRYFNPDWYNDTYFSLVSETCVTRQIFKYNKNREDAPPFITEKTYKPIMYRHPFLIQGQPGILKHLRTLGFETFENLFDESYDTIDDNDLRLDKIVDNAQSLSKHLYSKKTKSIYTYDKLTEEKITHNWNHFFNGQLVEQRIYQDIVLPFLEMCE